MDIKLVHHLFMHALMRAGHSRPEGGKRPCAAEFTSLLPPAMLAARGAGQATGDPHSNCPAPLSKFSSSVVLKCCCSLSPMLLCSLCRVLLLDSPAAVLRVVLCWVLLAAAARTVALATLLSAVHVAVAHSAAVVPSVWCRSAPGLKHADCGRSVPPAMRFSHCWTCC